MSIIGTTKELIALAKKGATVELELRLVQMQEKELELREEIVKLKSALANMKIENSTCDTLELQDGIYIRDDESFCQVCWDSDKKLINLQSEDYPETDEYERPIGRATVYKCLKCNAVYNKSEYF